MSSNKKQWVGLSLWLREYWIPIGLFLFSSGFDIFNLVMRSGGGFIVGVDWMMHWCLTWDVVYYHWIWGDYNFGWGGYGDLLWYYPPAIHVLFAAVWLLHGSFHFGPEWAWRIITRREYKLGCYLGFVDSLLLGERGTHVDIRITMALLDGIAVALTYLIAKRLSKKRGTAMFASLSVYFNWIRLLLLYKGHLAQIAAQCFSIIFVFLLIRLEERKRTSNTWIVGSAVSSSLMLLTHFVSVGLFLVFAPLYLLSRRVFRPKMSWKKIKIVTIAFLIAAIISWQVFWSYAWKGTLMQKDPNVGGLDTIFSYSGFLTSILALVALFLFMTKKEREAEAMPVVCWVASLIGIYFFCLPLSLGYRIRFIHATVEPVAIFASITLSRLEDRRSNLVKFGMILYLAFKIWFGLEFLQLVPPVFHELAILGAGRWTADFIP